MDIEAYLKRIHYQGSHIPTAQTLCALQQAHLLSVPFENLSIHWGQPIVLNDAALFDKVINRQRGGFCYELNGLFAALLRAMGFTVSMLSVEVAKDDGGFSQAFDHMALMVSLDGYWLVDVGFGDTFRQPLLIDKTRNQRQIGREYRLESDGRYFILMERKRDEDWKAQYRFNLHTYQYVDFADRCHYQQTSPDSNFTRRRICTLATPDGRVTLSEMRLIKTTLSGVREEHLLMDEATYAAMLYKYFGITRGL